VFVVSAAFLRFASLMLIVAGCDAGGRSLIVEIRTDLIPGVEFVTARASLSAPGSNEVTIPAVLGEDFTTSVRLAEFDGLADGSYELVVTASDVAGEAVVARTVRVELREDLAVTVALSRSCRDITCPMSGDAPASTTCAAGRCVDPACSELTPDRCEPGDCTVDEGCTMPSDCAVGLCVEGGCFYAADDTACPSGQTCSPSVGCVDVGVPMDASMDSAADTTVPRPDATPDAADATEDTRPSCASEVLLAATSEEGSSGGFSGSGLTSLVIVLSPGGGPVGIGDEDPLMSGYSGTTDFRASNDSDFDLAVAPFMDGSEGRPLIDVTIPAVVGGGSRVNVSASLAGTIITMVRRDVISFDFTSAAGRTDYDAVSQWEFWGCNAAP